MHSRTRSLPWICAELCMPDAGGLAALGSGRHTPPAAGRMARLQSLTVTGTYGMVCPQALADKLAVDAAEVKATFDQALDDANAGAAANKVSAVRVFWTSFRRGGVGLAPLHSVLRRMHDGMHCG